MLPPLNSLPVNWTDGMKITQDHFRQSEHAWQDALRDNRAVHLSDDCYGLLPPAAPNEPSLKMDIQFDRLILHTCRAVTRQGTRIEVSGREELTFSFSGLQALYGPESLRTMTFDVFILAHPTRRVPAGEPDPDETPLRRPFSAPEYRLEVRPADQPRPADADTHFLQIGKIFADNGQLRLRGDYIPPCVYVNCYPGLLEKHRQWGEKQMVMFRAAKEIFTRINIIRKPHPPVLKNSISYVMEKVIFFLNAQRGAYERLFSEQAPVVLFLHFATLARTLELALECTNYKENLLNFFYARWNVLPSEFESQVSEMANLSFQQNDLNGSMLVVDRFLSLMTSIFEKLSKIDPQEPERYDPVKDERPTLG